MIPFPQFLIFFAEINLSHRRGAAIYQIWQPYYLQRMKFPSIELFLSFLFKRFWSLPIKIRNC